MNKEHNKKNKHDYNLEKLDAIITIALIADSKTVYVPKRLYKLAKQMLLVKGLFTMTIKTY
jgi:hypothetical protein